MLFRFTSLLFLLMTAPNLAMAQQQKGTSALSDKSHPKPSANILFEKKKMLIGILKKQETDWNTGNMKGFLSPYWNSDTLLSVSVRGVQYGKERLERFLMKTFPDSASMGKLDYDIIHIELIGDNDAILTGKWLRKNDKKFRGGYFSILLRKLHGKWLIVSEHFG